MSQDFNITLNIAQIVLLAGLVWGLAKMSGSLETLRMATTDLVLGLAKITGALASLAARVLVLEDRGQRP